MIKKISFCGIFSALAIVISTLEHYVPLQAIIPLPGIKLGLSNCLIIYILYKFNYKYALCTIVIKCFVVSLLFTGFTSLIYSLTGGLFSLAIMLVILKFKKLFSIIGVSMGGAAFHSFGQICASSLMLGSVHIFKYLAVLLLISVFTGIVTGVIADVLINRIKLKGV